VNRRRTTCIDDCGFSSMTDKSNWPKDIVSDWHIVLFSQVAQKLSSVDKGLTPLPILAPVWRWDILLHSQYRRLVILLESGGRQHSRGLLVSFSTQASKCGGFGRHRSLATWPCRGRRTSTTYFAHCRRRRGGLLRCLPVEAAINVQDEHCNWYRQCL